MGYQFQYKEPNNNLSNLNESMSNQRNSRRATIAIKFAPAMMGGRRQAQVDLPAPKLLARPKSRVNRMEIEDKFANSYLLCVSSPRSYRRKRRPSNNNDELADVEQGMKRNIQAFKRSLAEHNEKTQDELINIPVFRVVKNLVLRDVKRQLHMSIKKWKRYMYHLRHIERKGIMANKACRRTAEDVVNSYLKKAASNVAEEAATLASRRSDEDKRMVAFEIQRWSTHDTLQLDGGSVNRRTSHYGLPSPDISSMYQLRRKKKNYHPKQMQHIEEEDVDTSDSI